MSSVSCLPVCPLIMVFYLGLMIGADVPDVMDVSLKSGKTQFSAVCYVLSVARALRWVSLDS